MNIHEHQAKQILKKFGAVVPEGVFGFTVEELLEKCKSLKTNKYVLKAQIHAGGRGKAGGVKILDNLNELEKVSKRTSRKKINYSSNRTRRKRSKKTLCRSIIKH